MEDFSNFNFYFNPRPSSNVDIIIQINYVAKCMLQICILIFFIILKEKYA